jgi:diketogulonate reductase-like aldo/keto reductase
MTPATTPALTLNNAVTMPALGLGVFQSPPEETTAAVETALRDGYRLIDTAAAYDNEREVGEGLRRSGVPRDEIFVSTKLWISDYGYDAAQVGFDASLRRLGVATQAWSPLGGVLVYVPGSDESRGPLTDPAITDLAAKYGKTPAQVVLRWHIEHGFCAIPKSVKPHRIAENSDVFDFTLTAEEVAAIDALDKGVRGGPDPETLSPESYPKVVDNS